MNVACYCGYSAFSSYFRYSGLMDGGSSVCWKLGWGAEGSWFKPQYRPKMEGVLVVGGGARTPLAHCWGTLEQGNEPAVAYTGACNELEIHPGPDQPLPVVEPQVTPKGIKQLRRRDDGTVQFWDNLHECLQVHVKLCWRFQCAFSLAWKFPHRSSQQPKSLNLWASFLIV